jgi:membrane carboxypeptidase/penicillin-binding protein
MQVGLASVANTAARFGLPKPQPYPAMALGTTEVTPLEVAAAYAAFANDGKIVQPTVVTSVMDGENVLTSADIGAGSTQVISPTTAYMITDMLSDVTQRGTARRAGVSFKNLAIAGKTGTSRDGWFVGYTPNLICAVWIGYDDNSQLGLTGADAALPAWIDFTKEALALRPSLGGPSFPRPAGITTVRVDPETGFLAGPDCPASEVVSVASRFAPVTDCYKHRQELPEILSSEDTGTELLPGESEADAAARAVDSHPETTLEPFSQDEESSTAHSESAAPPVVQRPTQKQVDQKGRPILVNAPVVPSQANSAEVTPKHR